MLSTVFRRYITTSRMVSQQATERVKVLINSKPIFIASKTYCPYCKATKSTIGEITKDAYILELDELDDGEEIQAALLELTGQRTVPNVFINGEHIGGNSDVQALKSSDKLIPKIKAAL
ncbi:thioredoxin-like protein [Scheffersomyces amazonensis]|uniref:thioredoxin-like protein n=1 Tax=Scheffersomyces amazonensis TaxID=1078765 RepID=UPI00315D9A09